MCHVSIRSRPRLMPGTPTCPHPSGFLPPCRPPTFLLLIKSFASASFTSLSLKLPPLPFPPLSERLIQFGSILLYHTDSTSRACSYLIKVTLSSFTSCSPPLVNHLATDSHPSVLSMATEDIEVSFEYLFSGNDTDLSQEPLPSIRQNKIVRTKFTQAPDYQESGDHGSRECFRGLKRTLWRRGYRRSHCVSSVVLFAYSLT